ncbi:MAG: hypothetical protein KF684_10780 [Phycisphaeraceae bacterium]|nr:hypothetical protein [Phycisphaeraceae bacterium]
MQTLLNPTLALIALGAALVLLALGLRGVRLDRDPRCRARRCRYPLRELLDGKRRASEPEWPITCPECGRVMVNESRTRRGARKKLRAPIAIAVVLALPSLGALGVEGYARWQSTKATSTMPLWLLLRQAPNDSQRNNWAHQKELLARSRQGAITGADAQRVIERILRWQNDTRVDFLILGDVATSLDELGEMTGPQLRQYWGQLWRFELVVPERVGVGEAMPYVIESHYRGGDSHNPGVPRRSIHDGIGHRDIVSRLGVSIVSLRIGENEIDLPEEQRTLYPDTLHRSAPTSRAWSWRSQMDQWLRARAPGAPVTRLRLQIVAEWQADWLRLPMTGMHGPRTLESVFHNAGLPTHGTLTLDAFTRVERGVPPVAVLNDPAERAWLESQMRAATLFIAPDQPGNIATLVRFPILAWDAPRPNSSTAIFGDMVIRVGDREIPVNWTETRLGADIPGAPTSRAEVDTLRKLRAANPLGWELVFIPRPERARHKAVPTIAFGGEPIVVPLTVEPDAPSNGFPARRRPPD